MKKLYKSLFVLCMAFPFVSCEKDLPVYDYEECGLMFEYQYARDSTYSYSFAFGPSDVTVDTVELDVALLGNVVDYDRVISLRQIPTGNNDGTPRCDASNRTPLNTGVAYDSDQTSMIYAVLHARRVEGIHDGTRWLDIKRYGIAVEHNVYNSDPIVLEANDLRKAIQLPEEVLMAPGGMEPNPR